MVETNKSNMANQLKKNLTWKLFWGVIILCGIWVFFQTSSSLPFWEMSGADYARLFTSLFLVSLFIERTLEVFITAWRGPEAKEIFRGIERLKAIVCEAKKTSKPSLSKIEGMIQDVDVERKRLDVHKSITQRLAFLASLSLGILISAVGIRAVEPLLDPAAVQDLQGLHKNIFGLVDVILTGALLGGGSDGIHKLVTVFINFLDATGKKFKGGEG